MLHNQYTWRRWWRCTRVGQSRLTPIRETSLVFHGLRKSVAVKLAGLGCTNAEIAALTGQTWQIVEYYAKGVDQKRLALSAMRK
jgi:hypothetical protein